MSFQNKNLYDLLGNDVEEDNAAANLPIKEVVRKNTSSKKADVPPPSADPTKAKKKAKPAGNEGALKTKNNNKDVAPPQSTATKHQKKPFDRHSRSGKTDSSKKIKQGWGNTDTRELEGEAEGTEDAEADLVEEAEEEVDTTPKKSLQEYLAEQEQKQRELDGAKKLRKANEGAEQKWNSEEKIEKTQEEYFASTHQKKTKSKAPKEKVFLEFDAVFADEQPQEPRGGFRGEKRGGFRGNSRGNNRGNGRGSSRGNSRGNSRGGLRGGKSFNENDFPSL
ncbi:hypothetical protein CANMA_002375 [Candida margitis]|uniref:uncharacterized protein n=1 Tax=Candida margitis TaxID=1775924 RepID=UPI002226F008|nr:uncharacterized protein CANMA_002375 [Candida margitis]KAI5968384.1 hypothetical protein CANMA_002375 [Candida margitis]